MAKSKRIFFQMECPVCKNRNYTSTKNPENIALKNKNQNTKFEMKKYCKRCRKVTLHKEVKIS